MQIRKISRPEGPHGSPAPESWISGVEHPALPPHPPLWTTPVPWTPERVSPDTRQLTLNPILLHSRFGACAVQFDLRVLDDGGIRYTPQHAVEPAGFTGMYHSTDGPTAAQPATWPGVGALAISMVADDREFPWPFVVLAHHPALPVTLQDVVGALFANFHQAVTQDELRSLGPEREGLIHQAYWKRKLDYGIPDGEGVTRVDYLLTNYMFRGLEPTPDGSGYVMFVGPPWHFNPLVYS